MNRRAGLKVVAAILLAACAPLGRAGIATDRLAAEGAALYEVLSQACLPYVFDGKPEATVMRAVGMSRPIIPFSWPDPPGPWHDYIGGHHLSITAVNLLNGECTIHASDQAAGTAYAQAVDKAFTQRFGDGYSARTIPPGTLDYPGEIWFADMVRICLQGRMVTYYPEPQYPLFRDGVVFKGFDVEILRGVSPHCPPEHGASAG